jgi:hypothetical protein
MCVCIYIGVFQSCIAALAVRRGLLGAVMRPGRPAGRSNPARRDDTMLREEVSAVSNLSQLQIPLADGTRHRFIDTVRMGGIRGEWRRPKRRRCCSSREPSRRRLSCPRARRHLGRLLCCPEMIERIPCHNLWPILGWRVVGQAVTLCGPDSYALQAKLLAKQLPGHGCSLMSHRQFFPILFLLIQLCK